ncbi:hypothetical protein PROFUN_01440 [Planoprotostelium fungivorum]|uniref:Uncharacterized protein n=1 Tax=Planoprotostelium fungivorum TaxID=1890364 RepID=A0A2P6NTI8_9EUKA|nr:hypothetical protein PROFUN_01440 [Planoprotostelium fungivorum]
MEIVLGDDPLSRFTKSFGSYDDTQGEDDEEALSRLSSYVHLTPRIGTREVFFIPRYQLRSADVTEILFLLNNLFDQPRERERQENLTLEQEHWYLRFMNATESWPNDASILDHINGMIEKGRTREAVNHFRALRLCKDVSIKKEIKQEINEIPQKRQNTTVDLTIDDDSDQPITPSKEVRSPIIIHEPPKQPRFDREPMETIQTKHEESTEERREDVLEERREKNREEGRGENTEESREETRQDKTREPTGEGRQHAALPMDIIDISDTITHDEDDQPTLQEGTREEHGKNKRKRQTEDEEPGDKGRKVRRGDGERSSTVTMTELDFDLGDGEPLNTSPLSLTAQAIERMRNNTRRAVETYVDDSRNLLCKTVIQMSYHERFVDDLYLSMLEEFQTFLNERARENSFWREIQEQMGDFTQHLKSEPHPRPPTEEDMDAFRLGGWREKLLDDLANQLTEKVDVTLLDDEKKKAIEETREFFTSLLKKTAVEVFLWWRRIQNGCVRGTPDLINEYLFFKVLKMYRNLSDDDPVWDILNTTL